MMKKEIHYKTINLTPAQIYARRSRAIGVAVALSLLIFMLYAASFAKLFGA